MNKSCYNCSLDYCGCHESSCPWISILKALFSFHFGSICYTNLCNIADLCSISDDGHTRIIPPEHGYDIVNRVDRLNHLDQKYGDIRLRTTSSNAEPVERRLKLHTTVDHFPNQRGRFVEFLDKDPPSDHLDDSLPDGDGESEDKGKDKDNDKNNASASVTS